MQSVFVSFPFSFFFFLIFLRMLNAFLFSFLLAFFPAFLFIYLFIYLSIHRSLCHFFLFLMLSIFHSISFNFFIARNFIIIIIPLLRVDTSEFRISQPINEQERQETKMGKKMVTKKQGSLFCDCFSLSQDLHPISLRKIL